MAQVDVQEERQDLAPLPVSLEERCAHLERRCARLEQANAQLLELLLGFTAGVLRVRTSLLANSTAES